MDFKIEIPPTTSGKVANGELTVTVAGGQSHVFITAKTQSEVIAPVFVGEDGQFVDASFVYVSTRGVKSEVPATIHHELVDMSPPPNPGPIRLVLV
jgi:hypothetical protein